MIEGLNNLEGNMANSKGFLPLQANVKPRSSFKEGTFKSKKSWSRKELDEKKAKEICYWCEEKYVPGHNCLL